jgi:hypothetical protein
MKQNETAADQVLKLLPVQTWQLLSKWLREGRGRGRGERVGRGGGAWYEGKIGCLLSRCQWL